MIDPEAALLMADSRFARGREYSAPLAGATTGRLELLQGASLLTLTGGASPDRLFEARFGSPMADVEAENSTVQIVYRKHTLRRQERNQGQVALNSSIPWNLVFGGGIVRVTADLRDVRLHAIAASGGISQLEILLPNPLDEVPISLTGGMHQVTIKGPAPAPVRLRVTGGAVQITFDQQRFGAVGGELQLASPGFETATARYDILASGGASRVRVVPL